MLLYLEMGEKITALLPFGSTFFPNKATGGLKSAPTIPNIQFNIKDIAYESSKNYCC